MKIKFSQYLTDDLPRERLLKYGVSSLSNEELLAIILKTGTKEYDVLLLSRIVLSKLEILSDIEDLSYQELIKIKGIGKVKALEILASIELGKRLTYKEQKNIKKLNNTKAIFNLFYDELSTVKQEVFYAVYLDNQKNYITKKKLFVGTLNMSLVHPREVFKYAYLNSAAFIICVHNHPSGSTKPSIQDIEITKRLVEIGKIQQIYVIDHIIIGNNTYYSFYENGEVIS